MFNLKNTFKSLAHRNFRLFFFAQMVSLIGTWVQGVAQSWLLWRLTNSQGLLGLLGFCQMSPVLFFGLLGGIFADRFERKKLLLFTQSLALFQSVVFAILVISGIITPLYIFILALFLGTVNAFDMTGRQTFLADLVSYKDVGNAIALNSLLFNIARVIGPPIGGFIISVYGESLCFVLNAVSFLFVLFALLLIKVEQLQDTKDESASVSFKETLEYFKTNRTQLKVLILMSAVSFLMLPYGYFLPYFADVILKGKADTLGFLLSSAGFGAMIGAVVMANHPKIEKLPGLLGIFSFILAVSLSLFSFSNVFYFSVFLLTIAGFSTMIAASSTNIFLQTTAPLHLRGRVISFYVTSFIGFPPIGGVLVGALAEHFNAPSVLLVFSILTALLSFTYLTVFRK
jgi:MFS family permease